MADKVAFTKPAAERIGRVVRIVEGGDRDIGPFNVEVPLTPEYRLRLGTFTGNWGTAQWKTVTYTVGTGSTTIEVYNHCNPAIGANTNSTTETRKVIFGRVSGKMAAVEIQMRTTQCTATLTLGSVDLTTLPGYDAGVIQLLGHGAQDTASTCSGGLQWYSITTCSTATAA